MSPRIKSEKSKHHRFELRLDDEMNDKINECSKKLATKKYVMAVFFCQFSQFKSNNSDFFLIEARTALP